MMNKISICLLAPSSYPLLIGRNIESIIGPDVHAMLLGKELLKHNFDITILTYDEGGPQIEYINGFRIIKYYRKNSNINMLFKSIHLLNALRIANSQIYYYQGGANGVISIFCKLYNRRVIYSISSDAIINRKIITRDIKDFKKSSINAIGNWLDIKFSDTLIVQSEYQKSMLKKIFNRESLLMKMPFLISESEMIKKTKPLIVLWVGAIAEVKQPELFIELAKAIPCARFQMIGGFGNNEKFYKKMMENGKRISNFEYLGVIPFDEIDEYFNRASLLVNTSLFEGFPHSFIQAWMHRVPIVSLHADPDEIICKKEMGFHSRTINNLIKDTKTLLDRDDLRTEMGINGRKYVEEEHNIQNLIDKYINILINYKEF